VALGSAGAQASRSYAATFTPPRLPQRRLLTGTLLSVIAGVGVLRFPDVFTRMHAAT
jgi:hypothetical protein